MAETVPLYVAADAVPDRCCETAYADNLNNSEIGALHIPWLRGVAELTPTRV